VLEAKPVGGRGKDRPRREWEECVEGLARKKGRRLSEVKYSTKLSGNWMSNIPTGKYNII
jgi:hypothetical protein